MPKLFLINAWVRPPVVLVLLALTASMLYVGGAYAQDTIAPASDELKRLYQVDSQPNAASHISLPSIFPLTKSSYTVDKEIANLGYSALDELWQQETTSRGGYHNLYDPGLPIAASIGSFNLSGLGSSRQQLVFDEQVLTGTGIADHSTSHQQLFNLNLLSPVATYDLTVSSHGWSATQGSGAISGVVAVDIDRSKRGFQLLYNRSDSEISTSNLGFLYNIAISDKGSLIVAHHSRDFDATPIKSDTLQQFTASTLTDGWSDREAGGGLVISAPGSCSTGQLKHTDNLCYADGNSDGNLGTTELATTGVATATQQFTVVDPGCSRSGGYTSSDYCHYNYAQYANLTQNVDQTNSLIDYDIEFDSGLKLNARFLSSSVTQAGDTLGSRFLQHSQIDTNIHTSHPGWIELVRSINATYSADAPTAYQGSGICALEHSTVDDVYYWGTGSANNSASCTLQASNYGFSIMPDSNDADEEVVEFSQVGTTANPVVASNDYNISINGIGLALGLTQSVLRTRSTQDLEAIKVKVSNQLGVAGNHSYSLFIHGSMATTSLLDQDIIAQHVDWGLKGLAGATCNRGDATNIESYRGQIVFANEATGLVTSTCQWFNPLSNSLATSTSRNFAEIDDFYEESNPAYSVSNTANTVATLNWLYGAASSQFETSKWLFGASLDGKFGNESIYTLRAEWLEETYTGTYAGMYNADNYPCYDLTDTCSADQQGLGVWASLAPGSNFDASREITRITSELYLPVASSLNLHVAGTIESDSLFDDNTALSAGLTFNISKNLELYTRVSTGFKTPDLTQVNLGTAFTYSYLDSQRAIVRDNLAVADNLQAETSMHSEVSIKWKTANFAIGFTIWQLEIDDPIVRENPNHIVSLACPENVCDTDGDYYDRINFGTDVNALNTVTLARSSDATTLVPVTSIDTSITNGNTLSTSGTELNLSYSADNFGIEFIVNTLDEYELDSRDFLGKLNISDPNVQALPESKSSATIWWQPHPYHYLALTRSQIDGIIDDRFATAQQIDAFETIDVSYNFAIPGSRVKLFSTFRNITDEQAPAAQLDLGYNSSTAQPTGSELIIGLRGHF